jgi:hypothetical protein
MVAGGDPPRLLEVDGSHVASPGIAFKEGRHWLLGRAAEGKSHLNPPLSNNRFWEDLREVRRNGLHLASSHRELAYFHLGQVWKRVKKEGDELIIGVPGHSDREILALILGIAEALSIPVKGFVSLPLAASPETHRDHSLIHLDIHLHRIIVTLLRQGNQLSQESVLTAEEYGLEHLYKEWVKAIADEFVRRTRFDPLHQASTEQELFDRLPWLVDEFHKKSTLWLEMGDAPHRHRIPLDRDLLKEKSAHVVGEMIRLIQQIAPEEGARGRPLALEVSHQVANIPGCLEGLSVLDAAAILPLKYGAGAMGLLGFPGTLFNEERGRGVPFLTRRPWFKPGSDSLSPPLLETCPSQDGLSPTHVLYRHVAHLITEHPLTFGKGPAVGRRHICLEGESRDVSETHGAIHRQGENIILQNLSPHGVWVNETIVHENFALKLGHAVRVGTPGETLRLICCLE